jgi:ribulose-5-phosphate 4-epimerase/fuculose-1-phosphate aldolase
MDTMTPDRVVVVDLDGNLLEGDEIPPSEVFIHTEIYRARPDVLSVVHTHQPMATLCGIVGLPILPVLHIAGPLVERGVPVWPCAKLVTDRELGAAQAMALGDHSVCHLQGHGIVSVDRTVQEATLGAIHLERLAEANFRAAQVNRPPRVIPPDELAQLKQQRAAPAGRWAYYVDLVTRHV